VKVARAYTKRQAIVCFERVHGRTLLALSLTQISALQGGFGPFAAEVYRVLTYCYRCTYNSPTFV
jgi:4-aminobutyrate aminotransferase-like enzyme